jgi:hypothetical protein
LTPDAEATPTTPLSREPDLLSKTVKVSLLWNAGSGKRPFSKQLLVQESAASMSFKGVSRLRS